MTPRGHLLLVGIALAVVFAASSGQQVLPRVWACTSDGWTLYSRAFVVDITELSTDKSSYLPGEMVSVLGTVQLVEQDTYYQNGCDPPYQQGTPFSDNPDVVSVNVASSLGSIDAVVGSSGTFIANIEIPTSSTAGTYQVQVTATCPSCAVVGQVQGGSQETSFLVKFHKLSATLAIAPPEVKPGESFTLSGTVTMEDGHPVPDAVVEIASQELGISVSATTDSAGAFSLVAAVPTGTKPQTYTVSATASKTGGYDTSAPATAVLAVSAYNPQLELNIGQGGVTGYPGDTLTLSGTGWVPNGLVTVDYGGLGSSITVTTDGSGSFTAQAITISPSTGEGSFMIKATQEPNLEATATATIKWHQLSTTISVNPSTVNQGDSFTINGTVTREDGQRVPGATVTIASSDLSISQTATTDDSGAYSISASSPGNIKPQAYSINAVSTKQGGYHDSPAATASVTIKLKPFCMGPCGALTPGELLAAAAGAGLGLAGGSALNSSGKDDKDSDKPGKRKMVNFRWRCRGGFGIDCGAVAGLVLSGGNPIGGLVGLVAPVNPLTLTIEIQELGGGNPGKSMQFTFYGLGSAPGIGASATQASNTWHNFNTSTEVSLESFAGSGMIATLDQESLWKTSTSYGANALGTPSMGLLFRNGQIVPVDASDMTSPGLQFTLGSVYVGYWRGK